MRTLRQRVREIFLWLSAVDRDVLEKCSGEEHRFIAAGGAVATTTGMAFIGGTFTFDRLVHLPLVPAVILGVALALAVMNLERYVQASIRRQRTTLLTLAQAAPRLALAVILGLVLAIPLTLTVFAPEVSIQVNENRDRGLYEAREQLATQFPEIPELEQRDADLKAALGSITKGAVLKTSPEYRALGRRMDRLQRWINETDDPELRGSYQRQAHTTLLKIRPLREQLLEQEEQVTAAQRTHQAAELEQVQDRLALMVKERDRRDDTLADKFAQPVGLADQMKALEDLKRADPAVHYLERVIWVFLLAIDAMPAVMKTLLSVGRPTLYERLQDEHEESTAKSSAMSEDLRQDAHERDLQVYYASQHEAFKRRLSEQIEVQKWIDGEYIRLVRDRLTTRVAGWARASADRYIRRMDSSMNGEPARNERAESDAAESTQERDSLGDWVLKTLSGKRAR